MQMTFVGINWPLMFQMVASDEVDVGFTLPAVLQTLTSVDNHKHRLTDYKYWGGDDLSPLTITTAEDLRNLTCNLPSGFPVFMSLQVFQPSLNHVLRAFRFPNLTNCRFQVKFYIYIYIYIYHVHV
jgi:hypothetical protein